MRIPRFLAHSGVLPGLIFGGACVLSGCGESTPEAPRAGGVIQETPEDLAKQRAAIEGNMKENASKPKTAPGAKR